MSNTLQFVSPNSIRSALSNAMSQMYQAEVPAYGQLVELVQNINHDLLSQTHTNELGLSSDEDTERLSEERHGAIRLGTAEELAMMARVFAVLGMHPVGYYDLSVASVPVHSTAFRPIERRDLAANPFRVFTSLLRLELIDDPDLKQRAADALSDRQIFTAKAIELTEQAELNGGLNDKDAAEFVKQVLETFRWHSHACVDLETFNALNDSHRLIADVVSFKGPHINHLTPRTLDIDTAQKAMVSQSLPAKAIIEGPPKRRCPILLRQTAFKAIDEKVQFKNNHGQWSESVHSARFGEIEQRGIALTPEGHALYDRLLSDTRSSILPAADGSNADAYTSLLAQNFNVFPDDWRDLHDNNLAYFKYKVQQRGDAKKSVIELLDEGILSLSPIIYEDFLPVSAAGIFQSNLGDKASAAEHIASSKHRFEEALNMQVYDAFELYEQIQQDSLAECLQLLIEH